jgi:hypothetical protein
MTNVCIKFVPHQIDCEINSGGKQHHSSDAIRPFERYEKGDLGAHRRTNKHNGASGDVVED